MHPIIAYRGIRFTIEYAIHRDGSVPALDFFNLIETRWQARLMILFKLLGDTGQIRNPEQFRKFTDGFFEFKAFQVRMPCYFRPDKRVVVTHGFTKKKDEAPRQEIERAVNIKVEYEERLTSEGGNRR
jgi:phage-related protein